MRTLTYQACRSLGTAVLGLVLLLFLGGAPLPKSVEARNKPGPSPGPHLSHRLYQALLVRPSFVHRTATALGRPVRPCRAFAWALAHLLAPGTSEPLKLFLTPTPTPQTGRDTDS